MLHAFPESDADSPRCPSGREVEPAASASTALGPGCTVCAASMEYYSDQAFLLYPLMMMLPDAVVLPVQHVDGVLLDGNGQPVHMQATLLDAYNYSFRLFKYNQQYIESLDSLHVPAVFVARASRYRTVCLCVGVFALVSFSNVAYTSSTTNPYTKADITIATKRDTTRMPSQDPHRCARRVPQVHHLLQAPAWKG